MGTEIEPVGVADLGEDAPADAIRFLEQHHVPVAQSPGGSEPGDAPTDHDRFVAFRPLGWPSPIPVRDRKNQAPICPGLQVLAESEIQLGNSAQLSLWNRLTRRGPLVHH